ncbi:MAG: CDF family Co(II)/Ni(II) efflux transporter DmeF [Deltaproteobacteria bacterium]|nr:CDF family Co(II)/Ni(II) efflux transporter DmeF [Deltaproteobacteria bacterium]
MHQQDIGNWKHGHVFGTEDRQSGETRTRWVVGLTLVMMVVEVVAGTVFGSMALLADGWHMATHAGALGISALAYAFARRRAHDGRYSFGTGKVGALGGFGSAVSLAVVAVLVLVESVTRLWSPVQIRFNEAIGVAAVGLVVNLASAWLLQDRDHADHHHAGVHHDHNLRGAYLHVVADALTSVLAILALLAGMTLGWTWVDAASGILGALVIGRWSLGLLRDTAWVLLDAEVSEDLRSQVVRAVEADSDNRVADLHLWRVGPKHFAAIVSLVTREPMEPDYYRRLLRPFGDLVHVTVEVNPCRNDGA